MRISDWSSDVCSSDLVNALHRAAGELQRVSAGVWWDRLKEWITAALIGLGLIFAAALAYRWRRNPKLSASYTDAPPNGTPKHRRAKASGCPSMSNSPDFIPATASVHIDRKSTRLNYSHKCEN